MKKTIVEKPKKSDETYKHIKVVWNKIRISCYQKSQFSYKKIGALGIVMDEQWKTDFDSFYFWSLKNHYEKGFELIRKDPKGHFTPDNCVWQKKPLTNQELIAQDATAKQVYQTWLYITRACYLKSQPGYNRYGAIGIRMSEEWKVNFQSFYRWCLVNGYKEDFKLIRDDLEGDFTPDNCLWVSEEEYLKRNQWDYRILEINGTTKALVRWAKEYNLNVKRIEKRMEKGLTGNELLKPLTEEELAADREFPLRDLMNEDEDAVRIHRIWESIKWRCYTPTNNSYYLYGGKGITVFEEWKEDFFAFYSWSKKNGYNNSLYLLRKDKNKDYTPENCSWEPPHKLGNPDKDLLTINGATKHISVWAEENDLTVNAIKKRLKQNVNEEDLLRPTGLTTVYQGKEISLRALAKSTGISYHRIYSRYQKGLKGEELLN